jgi:hypothetical protein
MPHAQTFQRALAATRGETTAAILVARAQARYDELYSQRPRFAHPALRWHLTFQILPGLALYQTLRENAAQRGATPEQALAETGAVLKRLDVLAPWLRRLRWLPWAPALFWLTFQPTLALFPASGWDLRIEENRPRRIAFTIYRCFYLDTLTAYGAPELTAHYCALDDIAYAALPPSIRWERTTTLGRGGPSCDFCYRRATGGGMAHKTGVADEQAERNERPSRAETVVSYSCAADGRPEAGNGR